MVTVRELSVGSKFKMFARYKDGSRRPKLRYGAEGARLHRAYLRVRNNAPAKKVVDLLREHAVGDTSQCEVQYEHVIHGVVEIWREPFDFSDELTVVEHLKGGVTMVRDEGFRLAPLWSGIKLQQRGPR